MANFLPLKRYMFYCLDRCIAQEHLTDPFLDIGCGVGDVSLHLAKRGWHGTAIDYSDEAVKRATATLHAFPRVSVRRVDLQEFEGQFNTIILWDVLEHVEHDQEALTKIATLLAPGGHLLIAVPSNPVEWRWDDEFYGHFRRYTQEDLTSKLRGAGLTPVLFWDFTLPVFWLLRRLYTRLKHAPAVPYDQKEELTKKSSTVNAWDIPIISFILNHSTVIWRLIYIVQFTFFRHAVHHGHEFFALAQRPNYAERDAMRQR